MFVLEGCELRFDAISEQRRAQAVELVSGRLGDAAELVECEVAPAGGRRWLDEPLERLGGKTPREAARDTELRSELERLLRGIENRADSAGGEGGA